MNMRALIIAMETSIFLGLTLFMAWVYQFLAGAGFWQAFAVGLGASLPVVLLIGRPYRFDIITRLSLLVIFLVTVYLLFLA